MQTVGRCAIHGEASATLGAAILASDVAISLEKVAVFDEEPPADLLRTGGEQPNAAALLPEAAVVNVQPCATWQVHEVRAQSPVPVYR